MKVVNKFWRKLLGLGKDERGSALVIVTLLLALLTIYVSASLTISTTDTISSNFEAAQQRGFYAAYSKLEQMSRDFSTLFVSSLSPSYDSMCQVVLTNISNPNDVINNFRIVKPNVNCPPNGPCAPGYAGKFTGGSDLYDLGWVGSPTPFCLVDVCNPNATPLCNFPARPPFQVTVQKGDYAGLQGFARRYRTVATAVSENRGGADVQITRDFDNYLLPLFQFGIFTDSDFELYIPPNWAFGGWVHTNGDFYVTGQNQTNSTLPRNNFSQYVLAPNGTLTPTAARITVAKHIIIGDQKTGASVNQSYMRVFKDSAGNFDDIDTGSALDGALVNNCNNILDPTMEAKTGTCGPFAGTSAGTVKIGVRPLRLPIQNILDANPIQLIKRGIAMDNDPARNSPYYDARYYYKPGIRITLADYQNQLPRDVLPGDSPSAGSGLYGGIQLDGPDSWLADNVAGPAGGGPLNKVGNAANPDWYYQSSRPPAGTPPRPIPRGYQPKIADPANGRPTGARVNGNRIHGWIKVELVRVVSGPNKVITFDITQEILNLGVTVPYMANTGSAFYYPRSTPGFPASIPLAAGSTGPYPDENSIIHLQRFAVPYIAATSNGNLPLPNEDPAFDPMLDDVGGANGVTFDYYASMAMRRYNNNTLRMFGIEDNAQMVANTPPNMPATLVKYTTRFEGTVAAPARRYAEPQPDPGGFYTDADIAPARAPVPTNNPLASRIDFVNGTGARTGDLNQVLSENVNLPKRRVSGSGANGPIADATALLSDRDSVLYYEGETTWVMGPLTPYVPGNPAANKHLIPFPINMFDSREGTPHEANNGQPTVDPPVPGLNTTQVSKNGVMNLLEIDMGNLGRMFHGDFNDLFAAMGNTPYRTRVGRALNSADLRDNIDINQDNGWLVYISDRRGDETVTNANPYVKLRASQPTPPAATPANNAALVNSIIGDGEYGREDVVWNSGGVTTAGSADSIDVKFGAQSGCTAGTLATNNKDAGKSPQDSNNDCFISRETAADGFSETAPYGDGLINDQATSLTFDDSGNTRRGNMIALTQVPTNVRPATNYSRKPSVAVPVINPATGANIPSRIEMFRRAVRMVNASSLFPTGQVPSTCRTLLGVTVISENPVYVFGNYNAPAGEVGDTTDPFPGIVTGITPQRTDVIPTSPGAYNGTNLPGNPCGDNCHVPAAIVADAISLLSGPSVGTTITNWSGANGGAGWLDARSFVTPYQAVGRRPARNTVYRFALISGFTPSWFPGFWGKNDTHQGSDSRYSSGALNNFPRFLEDWGQYGGNSQFATYAGSMIRIYKSVQANGAFKRNSSATTGNATDYVYVPPVRNWIFDTDFTDPCTLPPGSPFLQLLDFKGFQQSTVQR